MFLWGYNQPLFRTHAPSICPHTSQPLLPLCLLLHLLLSTPLITGPLIMCTHAHTQPWVPRNCSQKSNLLLVVFNARPRLWCCRCLLCMIQEARDQHQQVLVFHTSPRCSLCCFYELMIFSMLILLNLSVILSSLFLQADLDHRSPKKTEPPLPSTPPPLQHQLCSPYMQFYACRLLHGCCSIYHASAVLDLYLA